MAAIFVRSELGSQNVFIGPLAQRVFVIEGMTDRRRVGSALIDQNGYAVGGLAGGSGGGDGEHVRTVARRTSNPIPCPRSNHLWRSATVPDFHR